MDSSKSGAALLEDWNPLEEAYYDPNFNSYLSGPGADLDRNLQVPCKKNGEERIFRLFVKNIPREMTENGLSNIFSHFGDVKSVFIGRNYYKNKFAWGMIDYDNLRNAQDAIVAINLQPPYNLEVNFAISDKEKERLATEKKLLEEVYESETQFLNEKRENAEERPKIVALGLSPQSVVLSSFKTNETRTDDIALDYTFHNHYSGEYLCDATHRLYSHLLLSNEEMMDYLLPDNSSTSLQLSTPVSLLNCLSKKLDIKSDNCPSPYHFKNNGVYEFGTEYSNCEKCQLCGVATKNSCKNCQAWCCGTKCLLKHWSHHKMKCIPISDLSNDENSLKNNLYFNDSVSLADMQKLSNLMNTSEETSSNRYAKPECITAFLKEGFTGILQIQKRLSSSKFVVTLVCSELPVTYKIFTEVPKKINEIEFDESFKPEAGEVVGIESKEHLVGVELPRGYIYTKGQAVLCDFGNTIKYEKTKKLPHQLSTLPSLAVYCALLEYSGSYEDFEKQFVEGDSEMMEFVVTKCNINGTVEASFKSDSNDALAGKVMFSPFTYMSHVSIDSGSRVVLSAFYNCAAIYLQSAEPEYVEIFEKLMQDLAVHCQIEKNLDNEPAIGDMVAVQYLKNRNWYRGQLLKKENDIFHVIFVDYGHVEMVCLSQMKSLTNYLKRVPCCAVRVGLTDLPSDTPLTGLALQLLTNLCESSEPLKIVFSNNDLDSVKLLRQDKISISEELSVLIEPKWMKSIERGLDPTGGEVFMLDDLINCLLTEGKEYKLRVLYLSLPREITLCSTRSDLSKHVMSSLSSQLNEYCAALTNTSYNPRDSELCIVKLEDDGCWYRAVCLQTLFSTAQARVMFVDFGNICIVSHKNIRKICEDFCSTPAMTIMSNYEVIPENCSENLTKRLEELIQPNQEYTVVVKSLDKDTLYYNIDIPSVTSVLKEEHLL